ncbi:MULTISPECIES: hypothetical protein [Thalassospira]|jgi:hypothetical protein|uniref:Uncharacterized protein n=2 Tax=Thalassospira TaxID=168934 RepID=A0ABR5Y8X5_9PROT|nr:MULTISPECIES: hypothetical protein [Thalassospira]MAL28170.1 hypothetical protein [Thalassospira sp.]MBR9781144.1 hypothetical protein [Rhodospirillales bacterium]KEO58666.1 hypothetical protein SMB34_13030 [Thalassospira permensis NBRC 106175]KZD06845.1 hypothetical protein AUP40_08400 [Thalassospira xiamenensis]KZD09133.1 hypothetical protein AUP45_14070 [Thalassospira xiamenensis]|tara:strand:- start:2753 stop:3610 length:858 start_codon:yes stop_codon:yes gene_type:complete
MAGNRIRHLDALLGVDAWHKKKNRSSKIMTIHARVHFHKGRLGGGDNDNVEFAVRLKAAEILARPVGDVKINPEKTLDLSRVKTVNHTESIKEQKSSKVGGGLALIAKTSGILADASLVAEANTTKQHERQLTNNRDLFEIKITTTYGNDGNPIWLLSPAHELQAGNSQEAFLEGSGWDPKEQPLMTIRDERGKDSKALEPEVQLTIRCKREDIHISDIRYKAENLEWKDTKKSDPKKLFLAEQFLRNKLMETGLSFDKSGANHSTFTLCDLSTAPMIEEEWEDE